MKLEDFVVDELIKTTTYENNFKFLMKDKGIKVKFPEKSFHGKDETFKYDDGKGLFNEAIRMIPQSIQMKSKRKEISPGYQLNRLKRKNQNFDVKIQEKHFKKM